MDLSQLLMMVDRIAHCYVRIDSVKYLDPNTFTNGTQSTVDPKLQLARRKSRRDRYGKRDGIEGSSS